MVHLNAGSMYSKGGYSQHRSILTDRSGGQRDPPGDARCLVIGNLTWDEIVDELESARPGRRRPFLEAVHETLTTHYVPEKVVSRKDSLLSVLGSSIEKRHAGEAPLATECLNCVVITLGANSLSLGEYQALERRLRTALAEKANGELRRGACWSYAILAFFGCKDEGKLDEADDWFRSTAMLIGVDMDSEEEFESGLLNNATASCEISTSDKQAAREQYIEGFLWGWGLIITQWGTDVLAEWDSSPTEDLLDCVLRCLSFGDASLNVLTPACILLAVLLEARWHRSLPALLSGALERKGGHAAVLAELENRYKYVMDTVRNLCEYRCQRRHNRSKEARRVEKDLLRMVQHTAETGEGPSASLCLGSRSRATSFNTWIAYLRYEVFRAVLKGSTAEHLVSNKSLVDCVSFSSHRPDSLVGHNHVTEQDLVPHFELEVRLRDEDRKYRSQNRHAQRRAKQSVHLVDKGDIRRSSF